MKNLKKVTPSEGFNRDSDQKKRGAERRGSFTAPFIAGSPVSKLPIAQQNEVRRKLEKYIGGDEVDRGHGQRALSQFHNSKVTRNRKLLNSLSKKNRVALDSLAEKNAHRLKKQESLPLVTPPLPLETPVQETRPPAYKGPSHFTGGLATLFERKR